jgi:transposase-like protein
MRKSKFTESQIAAILKEAEAGMAVAGVARKHGVSAATFYAWRSKYGGMGVSDMLARAGAGKRSTQADGREPEPGHRSDEGSRRKKW